MKPIILSTFDVRAILGGRKTQIRQVIKPQPIPITLDGEEYLSWSHKEPYQPGQTLWVKETWSFLSCETCEKEGEHSDYSLGCNAPMEMRDTLNGECGCFVYRANYETAKDDSFPPSMFKWRSPASMPKEAARISLLVKSVMLEKLQDITEKDAISEGIEERILNQKAYELNGNRKLYNYADDSGTTYSAKEAYMRLWDSRNAKRGYPYESNPWVWKTEFERTEKP